MAMTLPTESHNHRKMSLRETNGFKQFKQTEFDDHVARIWLDFNTLASKEMKFYCTTEYVHHQGRREINRIRTGGSLNLESGANDFFLKI